MSFIPACVCIVLIISLATEASKKTVSESMYHFNDNRHKAITLLSKRNVTLANC